MRIKFHGGSDDIVGFEINGKADEWGCYQSGNDLVHLTARVATIGGTKGVHVHALYDGTWSFAVAKVDEGRSIPGWKFEIGDQHEYSVGLIIDTGDDLVEVVRVKQLRGEWVPMTKDTD